MIDEESVTVQGYWRLDVRLVSADIVAGFFDMVLGDLEVRLRHSNIPFQGQRCTFPRTLTRQPRWILSCMLTELSTETRCVFLFEFVQNDEAVEV